MRILTAYKRHGVSIVDTLVVIGIMGLLAGLLMPAIQRVRGAADQLACADNLRQLSIALHHYHADHGGFPPRTFNRNRVGSELSWRVLLLPYLEQASLWTRTEQARRLDPDPTHAPPHDGFAMALKVFVCPADARLLRPLANADRLVAGYSSYVGVGGGRQVDGIMTLPAARLTDVRDGTSNTLIVGERPPSDDLRVGQWYPLVTRPAKGLWGGPDPSLLAVGAHVVGAPCGEPLEFGPGRTNNPCDTFHFWSLHQRGANFLFADGSVRFLRYEARSLIPALATRAGGEAVQLDH